MKTSYFAKYKESNGVSIARSSPKWYTGHIYLPLAPPMNLVYEYKNSKEDQHTKEQKYILQYGALVLNKLNPHQVYHELMVLAGQDPVFLCWEKAGEFCHRRLVARWLMLSMPGLDIPEVEFGQGGQYVRLF